MTCTRKSMAALSVLLSSFGLGDSVNRYMVDDRQTGHNQNESQLNRTNITSLQLRMNIAGSWGYYSPITKENVMYYCATTNPLDPDFVARDYVNGKLKWSKKIGTDWGITGSVPFGGLLQVTNTGIIDGTRLYLATAWHMWIFCVDTENGNLIWKADLAAAPFSFPDPAGFGAPAITRDSLLWGVSSLQNSNGITKTPAQMNAVGHVISVHKYTGEFQWKHDTTITTASGGGVWSSAAVDRIRNLVFCGVGQHYEEPNGDVTVPYPAETCGLIALDLQTGDLVWKRQFTENDYWAPNLDNSGTGRTVDDPSKNRDWDVGSSPVLFTRNGVDYVGCGDKGGRFWVLTRVDGGMISGWGDSFTVQADIATDTTFVLNPAPTPSNPNYLPLGVVNPGVDQSGVSDGWVGFLVEGTGIAADSQIQIDQVIPGDVRTDAWTNWHLTNATTATTTDTFTLSGGIQLGLGNASGTIAASPAYYLGKIYVRTTEAAAQQTNLDTANPGRGDVVNNFDPLFPNFLADGYTVGQLAWYGASGATPSTGSVGTIFCIDALTGTIDWSVPTAGGGSQCALFIAGNMLWNAETVGRVKIHDLTTGAVLHTINTPNNIDRIEAVNITVTNGNLLVMTSKRLLVYGLANPVTPAPPTP